VPLIGVHGAKLPLSNIIGFPQYIQRDCNPQRELLCGFGPMTVPPAQTGRASFDPESVSIVNERRQLAA
jgi:hypothetical protein